ncbi:dop-6 [Pristionchus pacificus]|uniref:Dop-6 n=1 Tax=Pristionchus pacificus TaxID=54126 RepID=A0A2A6BF88_PRIPA|nr:dop-6 [Pristionchus pacificus]|eukprot:PDM64549.1 dop-6 [Pristionchus pacificus]
MEENATSTAALLLLSSTMAPNYSVTSSSEMIGGGEGEVRRQWWFLLLGIVPIICISGNVMVMLAVWTTKSLQTPTNHLLVSLAVADCIVGAFVMPFSIYLSINDLKWYLSLPVCHIFCVLDVMASTASIVHLVLISIDRLVAATKPAEYKTQKHRKRVHRAIGLTWIFCILLSLPLSFNEKTAEVLENEHHCGIYAPVYMLLSSLFAFYLPCTTMLITYGYIFYTLRKRLRAIQLQEMAGGQFLGFGADVGNITTSAIETVIGVAPRNRNMITWEKPQENTTSMCYDDDRPPSVMLEAVTLKQEAECSTSSISMVGPVLEVPRMSYKKNVTRRFSEAFPGRSGRRKSSVTLKVASKRRHSHVPEGTTSPITEDSKALHSLKPPLVETRKMRRLSEIISDWERPSRSSLSHLYSFARRESVYIARKKLAGLKDWALDLLAKLKSKQGMAIRREARATKLVATVMMVFLICWMPFFTLNMIKIYMLFMDSWSEHYELWFHWFTALGYLNSSINFFIYAAINQKFRHSFRRLLCGKRKKREKTRWLAPTSSAGPGGGIAGKCGCTSAFGRLKKGEGKKGRSSSGALRRSSMLRPEIIIDEVTHSPKHVQSVSISGGGNTTFRRSSDDCCTIRRSSSEIIGGIRLPSNNSSSDKRRGSGMSNSSASLAIHDQQQQLANQVCDTPNRLATTTNPRVRFQTFQAQIHQQQQWRNVTFVTSSPPPPAQASSALKEPLATRHPAPFPRADPAQRRRSASAENRALLMAQTTYLAAQAGAPPPPAHLFLDPELAPNDRDDLL